MADETKDRKAAEAEAQAEVKAVDKQNADAQKTADKRREARGDEAASGPAFVNAVAVTEDDLPSVEDKKVAVKRGDDPDPNEGWTSQSDVPFVNQESIPGYYVTKDELPTKEGLAAHGIDPVEYLAGVPVSK